ncbi:hypothetical protein NVP1121O_071 [Vibrio phage 1.121.O._10N.286.46.C4]|nr:hypothetical protein NVP1121O_071 [Vibrio phage 1.121.O._10N.286.46.C4]
MKTFFKTRKECRTMAERKKFDKQVYLVKRDVKNLLEDYINGEEKTLMNGYNDKVLIYKSLTYLGVPFELILEGKILYMVFK